MNNERLIIRKIIAISKNINYIFFYFCSSLNRQSSSFVNYNKICIIINYIFFGFFYYRVIWNIILFYSRRFAAPPGNPNAVDPGVTQEAADIFKAKTGTAYSGKIMTPKKTEPEPEVETLGKSDSTLSRRERLKRRRDAALQFAAIQKQGGKAQSGA